ncbi:MAG: DUF3284 domain-containing protein [Erysipelotrichaceae bacterium]
MLEFKKNINVSASDFYNTIMLSLAEEVKLATGKDISVSDLQNGYKYKNNIKRNGKWIEGNVSIKRPVLNREIMTTLVIQKATYEMRYIIEELSENSINVTHTQTGPVSENYLNRLLFKIKNNNRFKAIEKYIRQTKNRNL